MADPFLSEIRVMGFNFPPRGWALCNGQLLPINQNQALFSLMGTTYGGDGRVSFGLPNLQGRTPIHMGSGHTLGERGGEYAHTLSQSEIPAHTHVLTGMSVDASTDVPTNTSMLAKATVDMYRTPAAAVALEPGSISNAGGSQAHLNMQPYLALNFCVALQGIFPSQN